MDLKLSTVDSTNIANTNKKKPVNISDLHVSSTPRYNPSKSYNWIHVEDPFSQIRPHLIPISALVIRDHACENRACGHIKFEYFSKLS